jgi:SAM-dependent MidA family methyltransferase
VKTGKDHLMPLSPFVPSTAPFAEVMHRALYDPALGYYGRGPRRIGRSGDFFTAVSVGPLYGQLLAQVASDVWQSLGCPDDFTVVEQGAHDGQLAEDLWNGWPQGPRPRYAIIEPQPAYREAQRARLEPLMGERVTWADAVSSFTPPSSAFFLSNELLDAFPVHRVRWTGHDWRELHVTPALEWAEADLSDAARAEVALLPTDLPVGYTTEVHPAATAWMREMAALPFRGAILIADYGYEAAEYYTPERADGTLRRYFNHRSDGDVLDRLGECDLTAHINFTRLIDTATAAGLTVERFMDQGRFLTHAATPWLKSLDGKAMSRTTTAALRQFHTLTHPTHMGAAFRMLLLRKDRH